MQGPGFTFIDQSGPKEEGVPRHGGGQRIQSPLSLASLLFLVLFLTMFRNLEKAVAVSGVFAGVLEESFGKIPGKIAQICPEFSKML